MSQKTEASERRSGKAGAKDRSDKYRLQLEFTGDARKRLDDLREEFDSPSFAELIRFAIRLLGWYADQRRAGYKLALVRDNEPVRIIELVP